MPDPKEGERKKNKPRDARNNDDNMQNGEQTQRFAKMNQSNNHKKRKKKNE